MPILQPLVDEPGADAVIGARADRLRVISQGFLRIWYRARRARSARRVTERRSVTLRESPTTVALVGAVGDAAG
jgi:hypothetical protein